MPQKCDSISYCSPAPYREPRKQASNPPPIWRFNTMHLKPYPKPAEKELLRDSGSDGLRGLHLDPQGVLRTEWGVRQARTLIGSPSNGTANRCPLGVLSTNTLHCTTNGNINGGGAPISRANENYPGTRVRKTKTSSVITTFSNSFVFLSSMGLENEGSFRIYQGVDGEGPLDIWAVIKPGNTKEKIAIFAAQQCGLASGGGMDSGPNREGTAPDLRTMSMKMKNCWEGDCSVAKRRRKSATPDKLTSPEPRPASPEDKAVPATGSESSDLSTGVVEEMVSKVEGEEQGRMLSVVEMVAYLEQRASDQQMDSKPATLRSTITLAKSGSVLQSVDQQPQQPKAPELPEAPREEEGESVRVLDMVAKLESECLKRQNHREGGDLSRNNSLRRCVGRVLLAGPEASRPALPPCPDPEARETQDPTEEPARHLDQPCALSAASVPVLPMNSASGDVRHLEDLKEVVAQVAPQDMASRAEEPIQEPEEASAETSPHMEEPPPGMLFFSSQAAPLVLQEHHTQQNSGVLGTERSAEVREAELLRSVSPKPVLDRCSFQPPVSEDNVDNMQGGGDDDNDNNNNNGAEEEEEMDVGHSGSDKEVFVISREPVVRTVSHEFLEMRFKIQLLLEPQQYLAFLPHHIIIKIFRLLPTKSLAALKCTCLYFKFIIENYGIRPADSRWVCDRRYRDDPCKQCKRRYDRGDVSLCRWHHKPYCQALPYGPGYWMCCHGTQKDTPGCNVGLHDNHWVPSFHSINMPIYKKSRDVEEES